MRKITAFFMVILLAFTLCACGKTKEAAEEATREAAGESQNGAESFLRGTNPDLMEALNGKD